MFRYPTPTAFIAAFVLFFFSNAQAQTHFTDCLSRTSNSAVIIIPSAIAPTIDTAPLESGDEIAVYTPGGTCAGAGVWTGSNIAITIWGADQFRNTGFTEGQALAFRVWDASEQRMHAAVTVTYAATPSYLRSDGLYGSDALYQLTYFKVILAPSGAPSLSSPIGGVRGQTTTPTLVWSGVSGATSYEVTVSTSAAFDGTPVILQAGLSQPSYAVPTPLARNSTYYWRVRATNEAGPGQYSTTGHFRTTDVQQIALVEGWNLISGFVAPTNPSVEALFAPVLGQIVLVKHMEGLFWPEVGLNTLDDWSPARGYKVFTTAPATLELAGIAAAPEDTPIHLTAGWNMIGYPRASAMAVDAALASLGTHLILIKDGEGGLYFPEFPEINSIGAMEPGAGYMIYVDAAATLIYPAENGSISSSLAATSVRHSLQAQAGKPSQAAFSAHMLVVSDDLAEGETVTAQAGGRTVGEGRVREGKAIVLIRGDDPYTKDSVEGAKAGEIISLSTAPGGSPVQLSPREIRDGLTQRPAPSALYEDDAVWIVEVRSDEGQGPEGPSAFGLEANYPNPFYPGTTIPYSVDADCDVQLEVYNLLGQRVSVLVSEHKAAGHYEAAFDATGLSSGVYLYRLTAGDHVQTRQMMLMH